MFNNSLGHLEMNVVQSQCRSMDDPQLVNGELHGKAILSNARPASVHLWQELKCQLVSHEYCKHTAAETGARWRTLRYTVWSVNTEDASEQSALER